MPLHTVLKKARRRRADLHFSESISLMNTIFNRDRYPMDRFSVVSEVNEQIFCH